MLLVPKGEEAMETWALITKFSYLCVHGRARCLVADMETSGPKWRPAIVRLQDVGVAVDTRMTGAWLLWFLHGIGMVPGMPGA